MDKGAKIILFGGAGLVGQNLCHLLSSEGFTNLYVVDKNAHNSNILRRQEVCHDVMVADMAKEGAWQELCEGAEAAVMLQAQIGGLDSGSFLANNITATKNALAALKRAEVPYLVHISSSVVNSLAVDDYTESKKAQERLVEESGLAYVTLRPTLMFGWFDRKHLGWLARFMKKTPLFPIPGSGRYLRQPLYALDFCRIIAACLEQRPKGETYDISGLTKIHYIDLMRAVKHAARAKAVIVRIPYRLFWLLLRVYALFDSDPPFTTKQLEALVTPDEFPVIPWDEIFGVSPTPLDQALEETFNHPTHSNVVLKF